MANGETIELLTASICEAIALSSNWTVQEIRSAYEVYKSFDKIVAGINYANKYGVLNLHQAIDDVALK